MTLYNIFETDAWHSKSSCVHKATCTSFDEAVQLIIDNHLINPDEVLEGRDFDLECMEEWQKMEEAATILRDELELYNQTHGYETNYVIVEVDANTWD